MHCPTNTMCGTAVLGLALLGAVAGPALALAVVAAAIAKARRGRGFLRRLLVWWGVSASALTGLAFLAAAYVMLVSTRSGALHPTAALPNAHVAAAVRALRAGEAPSSGRPATMAP